MQWYQKSIQNIIIIRDHLQKNVSLSNSLELKKKEKKSFTRIGVSILEFYSTFC